MALLWADGFDHYVTNNFFTASYDFTQYLTGLSTDFGRFSGSIGAQFNHYNAQWFHGYVIQEGFTTSDTVIVGVGARVIANTTTYLDISLVDAAVPGSSQLTIRATGGGTIEIRRGVNTQGVSVGTLFFSDYRDTFAPQVNGTFITSSSLAFSWSNYPVIETRAKIDNVSGSVEVFVNGQSFVSASNINTRGASGANGANRLVLAFGSKDQTNVTHTVWLDDLWIMNNTGNNFNAPLGPVRISTFFPTGNGSVSQWVPTGSATNWQAVSQSRPDEDTTTTAADGSVLPQDQLYTYTTATTLPNSTVVAGVARISRMKAEAGGSDVRHIIRSNGTTVEHSQSLSPTGLYANYVTGFGNNPTTGISWTRAQVINLEAGTRRKV